MPQPPTQAHGYSLPVAGAIVMSVACALVVGFSFYVINYWPLPASVAPALDFGQGIWWGAVVGAITGFVLGYLTDDKHFTEQ